MATKFSPCKGSYVLNQFPSNVMFGMNGFHVSASGAIQGHHGPLVIELRLTPFSTVYQLYRAYPCFPGIILTSTPYNILSKPPAAFPHNPLSKQRTAVREE